MAARTERSNASQTSGVIYVGTYTEPKPFPSSHGEGIHVFRLDKGTGRPLKVQIAQGIPNPSFLAIHPGGQTLYAVSEIEDGTVSAFAIDQESGQLTFINQQPTQGWGPAHVSIDPMGRYVLVSNYDSGHWTLLPVQPDGSLSSLSDLRQVPGSGPNQARQQGPHAHMTWWDAAGRNILGCDLGIDRVVVWRLEARTGRLIPAEPPFWQLDSGSGPRFLAHHPSLPCVYVLKELNSTITVFAYDPSHGSLTAIQAVSTLPDDFANESTAAHVAVHPSGRFLYASNRGHDSIAAYGIDQATGKLRAIGFQSSGGKTPRNFEIDAAGAVMYIANQDSDTIVSLRIDQATGALLPTGYVVPAPSPACIVFRA